MPQDRRQLRTTTSISAVFSGKQLDFRTARPSKILATNSETVGFQDHSLRQSLAAAQCSTCGFRETRVVSEYDKRRRDVGQAASTNNKASAADA